MQLNAEDGGKRKYIMVQLPERIEENKPAYKAGYRTIDELGIARIEKAAAKIKEETDAGIDIYQNPIIDLEDEKIRKNISALLEGFEDLEKIPIK